MDAIQPSWIMWILTKLLRQMFWHFIYGSTSIKVCHNRRIAKHRVFKGFTARGKTSIDWFFGFKLHLVVNHIREIFNFTVTLGKVNDRKAVPRILKRVRSKVFAD